MRRALSVVGAVLALGLSTCASNVVTVSQSATASDKPARAAPGLKQGPTSTVARTKRLPHRRHPVVVQAMHKAEIALARQIAQERILGAAIIEDVKGAPVHPLPPKRQDLQHLLQRENGNALGLPVPIEAAPGVLKEFYRALRSVEQRQHKARVLAFGASHTQGDYYTGYLRYYLQQRFGDGGPGFAQLAQVNRWYGMLDTRVESKGFTTIHAQHKKAAAMERLGLLGARASADSANAFGRISPRKRDSSPGVAKQFELYYETHPEGGALDVTVNNRYRLRVGTRGPQASGYYSFLLPGTWEQIEVRPVGDGNIHLYGATLEHARPGVVLDTLGINGTRAANWLRWDERRWTEHVRRRAPDLVLLAYGTNETVDTRQAISTYRRKLTQVLERLRRATPTASCLLVGPGDFPKKVPGGWTARPRLQDIIETQRQLAPRFGCGFWDTYAFMGGAGSMQRWAKAYPAMGARDHIHLTPRGYVKLGMALGDALMAQFDVAQQRL